jgi:hypothetical protein
VNRLLLVVMILFSSLAAQSQTVKNKPMTDAEYSAFLSQTEATLPRLEAQLRLIKRRYQSPFAKIALTELTDVRSFLPDSDHPHERSLSSELDLCGSLERFDINVDLSRVYAPDLSGLLFRLHDDIYALLAANNH